MASVFISYRHQTEMTFLRQTDIVTACAFHAGRCLAVSGQWHRDGRLCVWNLASGALLARFAGNDGQIKSVALSAAAAMS